MKLALALVTLLSLSVIASTQELAPPKEISNLSWIVGTWSGSGKISFGGNETPITSTATVSIDGQFLKAVTADSSSGFTLSKTTMTSWEAAKSQYTSYSFTNIAPTARIAHGKSETDKMVMVSEPWTAEGMTAVFRESLSKVSDKKIELVLEMKMGEKWSQMLDIVLTKK